MPMFDAFRSSTLALPASVQQAIQNPTNVRYVQAGFTPGAPFYQTIGAALSAAISGDKIEVFPGIYNEQIVLKDGVNIFFHEGATVNWNGATGDTITDNGVAITAYITGKGVFDRSGTDGSGLDCVGIDNASSVLYIEARKVTSQLRSLLNITGTLYGDIGELIKTTGSSTGITGAGKIYLSSKRIESSVGNVIALTGDAVIIADIIRMSGTGTSYCINSQPTGSVFIIARLIENLSTGNARAIGTGGSNTGKVTVIGATVINNGDIECIAYIGSPILKLIDCHINPKSNTVNAHGVSIETGTGIILQNCSIQCTHASAESIHSTSATAQDVIVYGTVVANRAKDIDVTVRVGTLVVDSTYVKG